MLTWIAHIPVTHNDNAGHLGAPEDARPASRHKRETWDPFLHPWSLRRGTYQTNKQNQKPKKDKPTSVIKKEDGTARGCPPPNPSRDTGLWCHCRCLFSLSLSLPVGSVTYTNNADVRAEFRFNDVVPCHGIARFRHTAGLLQLSASIESSCTCWP